MVLKLTQAIAAVCLAFLAASTWNAALYIKVDIQSADSDAKAFALPDFPYPYNVEEIGLLAQIDQLETQLEFMTFTRERASLEAQLLVLLKSKASLTPYDYEAWHDLYQLLEHLNGDKVSSDNAELFWVHDKYQKLGGWDSRRWLASLNICASQFQALSVESKNYCRGQLSVVDSLQKQASVIGVTRERAKELEELLNAHLATSTVH